MTEFNETLIFTLKDIPSGYLPPTFPQDLRDAADLYSKGETNTLLALKADQTAVDLSLATLSAEVATKAPIASPVFSGVPTGPTPATISNDNTIATTAYVVNKIAATYTAADVLSKLLTVDGIGSGLDSEKLGGIAYSSYALLASPTFTGNPTVPNQSSGDNSTRIASTQHVTDKINLAFAANYTPANTLAQIKTVDGTGSGLDTDFFRGLAPSAFATPGDLTAYAPLASPAFSGTPTAPTPSAAENSTRIATTAFVQASYAPLASPALTGNPTAPTQTSGDNSTKIATTANVESKLALIYQVIHTWSATQTYSAGVSFGSITAGTPTDLTNHIRLHGTNYGFSVSASQLNHVSGAAHVFYSGTTEVARISNTGNMTLLTALPISEGGTGAETAAAARTNLGLAAIASSGSASDLTTGTANKDRLPATMNATTFPGITMTGTLGLAGNGGTNQLQSGTGDGASYSLYNFAIKGWFGMGMIAHDNVVRGYYDFRAGKWDILGGFFKNGVEAVYRDGGTYTINITGNAATATSAGGATNALQAQRLRHNNDPSGTAMTFNWSGQGGQPTWLWGSNDGTNQYVWNPSNFSVDNAAKLGGVSAASYLKTADLGQAFVDIGHNAVGSVAMLRRTGAGSFIQGDTSIGSQLLYSNADASATGSNPSGTWACQGRCTGGAAGGASVAMWKRIS